MTNTISKRLLTILTFTACLSACTTMVDYTTSEPIQTSPSQRSLGTYIDDKRLQIIVGVNIRKADPDLKKSHIDVTSVNGLVLLTGQVPTAELRELAAAIAGAVDQVRQVHNELQVTGNAAFLVKTNDTWIATKVKAVLIANKDVDEVTIKTVIEDGVVYLMGRVQPEVADKATNLVSNISGVKEVVRVFEYLQ